VWGGFKRRKRRKILMAYGGHGRTSIISNVTIGTLGMFPDNIAKVYLECCGTVSINASWFHRFYYTTIKL
jgi:hypothetical protein